MVDYPVLAIVLWHIDTSPSVKHIQLVSDGHVQEAENTTEPHYCFFLYFLLDGRFTLDTS
jgi:hypothetical protein